MRASILLHHDNVYSVLPQQMVHASKRGRGGLFFVLLLPLLVLVGTFSIRASSYVYTHTSLLKLSCHYHHDLLSYRRTEYMYRKLCLHVAWQNIKSIDICILHALKWLANSVKNCLAVVKPLVPLLAIWLYQCHCRKAPISDTMALCSFLRDRPFWQVGSCFKSSLL